MISVIITTYNKAKYLSLTLAGYVRQSFKDFELVIVDDGSTDDTSDVIKKYSSILNIKYIPVTHIGIAKAKNKGIENASYDYVILTDDDRIPCDGFVEKHKKRLDEGKKCVVIGKQGLILSYFNKRIQFGFQEEFRLYDKYPELLSCEEKQMFDEKDVLDDFDGVLDKFFLSECNDGLLLDCVDRFGEDLDDFELAWSKAYGGNISFSKKYLTEQPVFDGGYKGYGIEDIDFSYQLYLQGYKFIFDSGAINYHQEHPRGNNEIRDMFQNYKYFSEKYPGIDAWMLKLDWFGAASLYEVNAFRRIFNQNKDVLRKYILNELCVENS